jgi:hypothetical protein
MQIADSTDQIFLAGTVEHNSVRESLIIKIGPDFDHSLATSYAYVINDSGVTGGSGTSVAGCSLDIEY